MDYRPRGSAPAGIKEESGEMAGIAGHSSISDEQDFAAVAARETIESDKERLARNRAQYQVIRPDQVVQPGALPKVPVVDSLAVGVLGSALQYQRQTH